MHNTLMSSFASKDTAPAETKTTAKKQKMDTEETQELVHVKDLTFNYFEKKVLYDLSLDLCPGQRCLVVGANGGQKYIA